MHRRNALCLSKATHKIIYITEATLLGYGGDGQVVVGEQLFGQFDTLAVDEFERTQTKLFLKPFKEGIAAEIRFPAKRIHGNGIGQVFVDIVQNIVQTGLVLLATALHLYLHQVLTLHQSNQQLFHIEVGVDILGLVATAANAHQLIDDITYFIVVLKMVLVELESPVVKIIGVVVVKIIEVL